MNSFSSPTPLFCKGNTVHWPPDVSVLFVTRRSWTHECSTGCVAFASNPQAVSCTLARARSVPTMRGKARGPGYGQGGAMRPRWTRGPVASLVLAVALVACVHALTPGSAAADYSAGQDPCQWVSGTCQGQACNDYISCAQCPSVPIPAANATTVWVAPKGQEQQHCDPSGPVSLPSLRGCEVLCSEPYTQFPPTCRPVVTPFRWGVSATCSWQSGPSSPCTNLRCLPECSQPPRVRGGHGAVAVQPPTYDKLSTLNVGTTAAATCDLGYAQSGTSDSRAPGGFNCQCIARHHTGAGDRGRNATAEWADAHNSSTPCNITCTRCPAIPGAPGQTAPFLAPTSTGAAVTTVSFACPSGSLSVSGNCSCLSVAGGLPSWRDSWQQRTPCDPRCAPYPSCPPLPAHNSTLATTPSFAAGHQGLAPSGPWSVNGAPVGAAFGGIRTTRVTWTCDPGFCLLGSDGLCRRDAVDVNCIVSRSPVTGHVVADWVEASTPALAGAEVNLARGCQPLALRCQNLANQSRTSVTRCTYTRNATQVPAGTVCATACFLGAELADDNGSENGTSAGDSARGTTCAMPPNGLAPGGRGVWTAPVPACEPTEEADYVEAAFGQVFEVSVFGMILSAAHSMTGSLFGTTRVPAATVRQHVALGQHMFTMSVLTDAQGVCGRRFPLLHAPHKALAVQCSHV